MAKEFSTTEASVYHCTLCDGWFEYSGYCTMDCCHCEDKKVSRK